MSLNSLWKIQDAMNVEKMLHKDAQDARINGTAPENVN